VVLVESLPNGVVQWLYILPDKVASGTPRLLKSRQYRAKYPVVAIHTVVVGQDPDGFVHTFIANQGMVGPNAPGYPIVGFGFQSWVLRTQTLSGYIEEFFDGTTKQSTVTSGAGGEYCASAASYAGLAATTSCMVADVMGSAVAGIVGGVTVAYMGTQGSMGLAAPEVAVAGLGFAAIPAQKAKPKTSA